LAHHVPETPGRPPQRPAHVEQLARFVADQLAQPFVGEPDVENLVGQLGFEEVGQERIALVAHQLCDPGNGVQPAGLEGAVLDGQAAEQAVGPANDPVLEVHDGELAHVSPHAFEPRTEHPRVPRLVGALAGKPHPQRPVGLRKVGQAGGRALQAVHLFVHLAVGEFDLMQRVIAREVLAVAPALLDGVAGIARRPGGEQVAVGSFRAELIRP
jgi:hypothetical protein